MGELDEAMCEAIALGERAGKQGDVPVGAVVLDERGTVIGRGRNRREAGHDPLAHAEIEAMREAAQARGDWNLADCTLVVTLEPCPMCAGAIVQSRMKKVVIATMNPKAGCAGSVLNLLQMAAFNHQVEIEKGVLEEECSTMLSDFFRELREKKKRKKQETVTDSL